MTVSWYPKNIILGLILLAALAVALNIAVDVGRGVAVGVGAALVYAIVDLMFSINPAAWRRRHRAAGD